jgi:hypothetical protein
MAQSIWVIIMDCACVILVTNPCVPCFLFYTFNGYLSFMFVLNLVVYKEIVIVIT